MKKWKLVFLIMFALLAFVSCSNNDNLITEYERVSKQYLINGNQSMAEKYLNIIISLKYAEKNKEFTSEQTTHIANIENALKTEANKTKNYTINNQKTNAVLK